MTAQCTINVVDRGVKDMESDYLPHVVACENPHTGPEGLKAQAVAARGYAYYKIKSSGSIKDGQSDQVYSTGCSNQPKAQHYAAVKATAGQVLVYQGTVIAPFYVAGAKPSSSSCIPGPGETAATEKYVTYNEGKTGSSITQSTLGWVNKGNKANRGCMSQNGAKCLDQQGKTYQQILRFYYGADIQLVTAQGSCINTPQDAGVVSPDQGTKPQLDAGVSPDSSPPQPPDAGTIPRVDLGGNGCVGPSCPKLDASEPAVKMDGYNRAVDPLEGDDVVGGCGVGPTRRAPAKDPFFMLGLVLVAFVLRRCSRNRKTK